MSFPEIKKTANQPRRNKRINLLGFTESKALDRKVHFEVMGSADTFEGDILTLSQSGLSIGTQEVPLRGSEVLLRFNFGQHEIQCLGRVLYVNRVGDGLRPQGFGVKFTKMVGQDYSTLKRVVEYLHQNFFTTPL